MESHETSKRARFDFQRASGKNAADERLKTAVSTATQRQYQGRLDRLAELPDSDALRTLAGKIKQHALDHLDFYLEQLGEAVRRNGGHFHMVSTAEEARELILEIADKAGCKRVIKSKSMVSEEIELTAEMERRGMDVVETDLGEFIAQIGHEKPSHIVAPIVHKDKASVAKLFSEYFHTPYNDDPESLTKQARLHLRDKFRRADLGMTGANFLVAETGQVCAVENEGNARQSITTPRVLVTLSGIEKIVPRLADLAVMLKLLARSSTGQHLTIYTNLFGGPRKQGEKDGPEEFHLILLDGGRSEILGGQFRETLRCIRCGACLNACPVFRKIGGHAYGHVYSGPIGALITPLMNGLEKYQDLPQASSLCGACYEACPVKIDIPRHLVNLRREMVGRKINSRAERAAYRLWAWAIASPFLYAAIGTMQRWELRRRAKGTGWVARLPKIAAGWTDVRDMPAPAKKSFHQLWKERAGHE
ncbi:MAG: LutB/LldF family L-lactate oxidation iron-sulfur protein [Tepidisphaeraceae bacterium]